MLLSPCLSTPYQRFQSVGSGALSLHLCLPYFPSYSHRIADIVNSHRISAASELQALVEDRTRLAEEAQAALEAKDHVLKEMELALGMADRGSAIAAEAASATARSYENLLAAVRKEQLNTAMAAVSLAAGERRGSCRGLMGRGLMGPVFFFGGVSSSYLGGAQEL